MPQTGDAGERSERESMAMLLADPSRRRVLSTWLVVSSVGGALVFTLGWLIAGAVQERYDPRSDYISSLAAVDAAHPWIVILALVMFGIGVLSLGAGLLYVLPDSLGRAGSLGVMLSGLGVIVIGSVRHDCGLQFPVCSAKVSTGDVSLYHEVHDVASVATFLIAGGSQLLISWSVGRYDAWRRMQLPSVSSGIVTLVLFTLMSTEVLPHWLGAIQRAIAVVACIWVSTLGVHLYRSAFTMPPVRRLNNRADRHSEASITGSFR
ncbi:DUF998 domain-containing protein [Actinobacteria bacterium YIM 96077]|uniref:DUF998 domain-containing protein n=1 Tax=Phytoactinopolyspora halophila TaxID=1981511 RepID=A0A329QZ63_9ACTN|nr:DUF998 domain-containing protein [Phytoactinopolyspora halophila]AYY13144.1 DUF998 domain-containing protein [Actinobacteria bacterium YIM 96077]RAW17615.1 hypothetical protein DPM12_06435 [Phytoactinopolyspora halophila]